MSELPQPIAPLPAPQPRRTGHLHPDDLDASLRGLQPGLYAAADLYSHYTAITRAAGRTPAAPNSYGKALARIGYHSRHDTTGRRRCWIIE